MPQLQEKIIEINNHDLSKIMNSIGRIMSNPYQVSINGLSKIRGSEDRIVAIFDSADWESRDLRIAHAIKPAKFIIKLPSTSEGENNSYDSKNSYIWISISHYWYVFIQYLESVPKHKKKSSFEEWLKGVLDPTLDFNKVLPQLCSGHKEYANVLHELSHWYRDATGNGFIQKQSDIIKALVDKRLLKEISTSQEVEFYPHFTQSDIIDAIRDGYTKTKHSIIFAHYEVDAQAHSIAMIKKLVDKKTPGNWDTLDFAQVFVILNDSLGYYVRKHIRDSRSEVENWILGLWKRCYREPGLLGKGMLNLDIASVIETALSFSYFYSTLKESGGTSLTPISIYKWWDSSSWGV